LVVLFLGCVRFCYLLSDLCFVPGLFCFIWMLFIYDISGFECCLFVPGLFCFTWKLKTKTLSQLTTRRKNSKRVILLTLFFIHKIDMLQNWTNIP
jgi:hypothetical protein